MGCLLRCWGSQNLHLYFHFVLEKEHKIWMNKIPYLIKGPIESTHNLCIIRAKLTEGKLDELVGTISHVMREREREREGEGNKRTRCWYETPSREFVFECINSVGCGFVPSLTNNYIKQCNYRLIRKIDYWPIILIVCRHAHTQNTLRKKKKKILKK